MLAANAILKKDKEKNEKKELAVFFVDVAIRITIVSTRIVRPTYKWIARLSWLWWLGENSYTRERSPISVQLGWTSSNLV